MSITRAAVWMLLFVMSVPLAVHAQPSSFPSPASYRAGSCGGNTSTDPIQDANAANDERDIVGDATYPALYTFEDGTYVYFRLRLDAEPRIGGGSGPLAQSGWGVALDVDGNSATPERTVVVNGITEQVLITGGMGGTLTPTIGTPGYVDVTMAADGSNFGGDPDFFLTFAAPLSALALSNGAYRVWAGTSTGNGGQFTLDFLDKDLMCWNNMTAPTAMDLDAIGSTVTVGTSIGITSPANNATVLLRPTIAGTSEPGSTVTVTLQGTSGTVPCVLDPALQSPNPATNGNWQCRPAAALPAGSYTVTAVAMDGANTAMAMIQLALTLNVTVTAPADGAMLNASPSAIQGTVDNSGATVTVAIVNAMSQTVAMGSASVAGDGSWTFTPSSPLGDGTYTATVTASLAGTMVTAMRSFSIDSTGPMLAITAPTSNATLNATTRILTPAGTTDAADGSAVMVTVRNVLNTPIGTCNAMVSGGGWVCSSAITVPEGVDHTLVATAEDGLGNTTTVQVAFNVDATPPALSIDAPGSSTINTTMPPISGATNADAVEVRVTLLDENAQAVVMNAVAAISGGNSWSFTLPSALTNGQDYTLIVRAVDAAGNLTEVMRAFAVDVQAPSISISMPADDQTVASATPVITGTTDVGVAEVTLTLRDGDDEVVAMFMVMPDAGGAWMLASAQYSGNLPDGTYTVTATVQRETSTNEAVRSFQVDTTGPTVAIVNPPDESTVSNRMPTITGTLDLNDPDLAQLTVVVTVRDSNDNEVSSGQAQVNTATGAFSYTLATPLTDGVRYTIQVQATDPVGNEGTAMADFDVDADAPALVITQPEPSARLSDSTPTISGMTEPGSTLTLSINGGAAIPVTVDGSGQWTFTVPEPLSDGMYTVVVSAENANGSSMSSVLFTIDTQVTLSVPNTSTLSDSPSSLSGTSDPGATIIITIDGVIVAMVTADGEGNWSYTFPMPPPFGDGEHTLRVTARDSAGNEETFESVFCIGATCEPGPGPNGGPGPEVRGGATGGAGCSVTSTSSGISGIHWWILTLMVLLFARRRDRTPLVRSPSRVSRAGVVPPLVLFVALFAQPPTTRAETGSRRLVLDQYRPSETADDGFALSRPMAWDGAFGARLDLDYGRNPLVYETDLGDADSETQAIVEHQLVLHAGVAIGLWDRLLLFVGIPVTLWMDGDAIGGLPGPDGTALGDVNFGGRLVFFRTDQGLGGALQVSATAPTAKAADEDATYVGESSWTVHPELLFELPIGPLHVLANVGARVRHATNLATLPVNDEFTYALGLWLPLFRTDGGNQLTAHAEAYGATTFEKFGNRQATPIEALGGFKYRACQGFTIGLAGGSGLTRGYGAPDVRGVFTLGFAAPCTVARPQVVEEAPPPAPADPDGDGLMADADRCPTQAEDRDGFEDADGCPDEDNDRDQVPDGRDQAPMEAEDRDGFQDDDGVPEPDNDQDGVADTQDACPLEAEDRDAFEDDNGCPDNDNDQDGIPDGQDECPTAPGKSEDRGCPKTIRVEGDRIVILQRVEFATRRERILARSEPILEEIRALLQSNPQIRKVRIEGHTDDRGNDEKNMTLSHRRAESVKQWLIEHGIDEARLEAQGFGETRPLESNRTNRGRQANRRVEFHIVDPASPSGASNPGSPTQVR